MHQNPSITPAITTPDLAPLQTLQEDTDSSGYLAELALMEPSRQESASRRVGKLAARAAQKHYRD